MKRFFIVALLLLTACSQSIQPTSSPSPFPATQTRTPRPTPTHWPTNTPYPTLPPSPTEQPAEYEGTGDDVVELPKDALGVLHIIGNASSRHFAVEAYDANNNEVDLLVNTTDPYDGRVALNFLDDGIARLLVKSNGSWTIKYIPLSSYDHIVKDTGIIPLVGKGDDVWVFISTVEPKIVKIAGNASSRYFGVKLYGEKDIDLAVNTTDPYDSIYLYPASLGSLLAIIITAEGEWNIIVQE